MGDNTNVDGKPIDQDRAIPAERETTFEDLDFRSRGHEQFVFADEDD